MCIKLVTTIDLHHDARSEKHKKKSESSVAVACFLSGRAKALSAPLYMRLAYYEDKLLLCLFLRDIVMWKDKIVLSSGCLGSGAGLVCEGKNFFCLLSSRDRLQASGSFIC
jgi:hypothetical protein